MIYIVIYIYIFMCVHSIIFFALMRCSHMYILNVHIHIYIYMHETNDMYDSNTS